MEKQASGKNPVYNHINVKEICQSMPVKNKKYFYEKMNYFTKGLENISAKDLKAFKKIIADKNKLLNQELNACIKRANKK